METISHTHSHLCFLQLTDIIRGSVPELPEAELEGILTPKVRCCCCCAEEVGMGTVGGEPGSCGERKKKTINILPLQFFPFFVLNNTFNSTNFLDSKITQ